MYLQCWISHTFKSSNIIKFMPSTDIIIFVNMDKTIPCGLQKLMKWIIKRGREKHKQVRLGFGPLLRLFLTKRNLKMGAVRRELKI